MGQLEHEDKADGGDEKEEGQSGAV